jgi:SAM-dependent methyltransferase
MEFTAHNILLNNGKKTLSDKDILLSESAVWKSIVKSLDLFFPGTKEERKKLRVVDLGCLEGGYAVEFAKLGFDTLGIEAREDNLQKCEYVKSNLGLTNVNFVKDDVRNLANYGKFDIVLCYGLLYHLNDPIAFLKTVSECTNKLLFLNTHFATERDIRYGVGFINTYFIAPLQKRTKLFEFTKNHRLSPITTNEGYRGRWMKEWSKGINKSRLEKLLWASYNNDQSFWLCKKDLTMAMHDVGFNSVFEQFDYTGDIMPHNYTHYMNRAMFVAVKH